MQNKLIGSSKRYQFIFKKIYRPIKKELNWLQPWHMVYFLVVKKIRSKILLDIGGNV